MLIMKYKNEAMRLTPLRKSIFLLAFLVTHIGFSQTFLLPNEELIYSFETQSGKKLVLVKDKTNAYIIYRFGSKTKIEFEYPEKNKDSWSKFSYSFYLRGGGLANEEMDLNYVYFTNNNFRYLIYDTYYAVDNKQSIGIKVTNLTTNKATEIKGNKKTQKGTLTDFRENHLLKTEEKIFE
jgi:hypothetical protein